MKTYPKYHIFYKYLKDTVELFCIAKYNYDIDVIESFSTIEYLGGWKKFKLIREKSFYQQEKGFRTDTELHKVQINLWGPSLLTCLKSDIGLTSESDITENLNHTSLKFVSENNAQEPVTMRIWKLLLVLLYSSWCYSF